jgi:hypothetical protein
MGIELKQTQVTDQNRDQFYKQVYPHQLDSKQQLINLNQFDTKNVVAIDCCGWHYRDLFLEKNVLSVDPVRAALEFKLSKDRVYKLVDNRNDHKLVWPKFDADNCTVLFDRSPILKYKTLSKLTSIFDAVVDAYQPKFLVVRLSTVFIDSNRLTDRFYELATVKVKNSVVKEFRYNTYSDQLYICFEKCYDPN